jgi:hypothetical protein
MTPHTARPLSVPDTLIAWTTSAALIAFGLIFFDDAVIMGRTILSLGLLSAGNELLKLPVARSRAGYQGLRLLLALAYVALMLIGFLAGTATR